MWAATIRRLHDGSYSGWNIAILAVPMWRLWIIWDLWTPGDEGENEYGSPVMETMDVQARMKELFKVIRVIAVVLPVIMTGLGILNRISRHAVEEQMENRIETVRYADSDSGSVEMSRLLREYNMSCPWQNGPVTIEKAELDWENRMFQYNYTIDSKAEGFDVQQFKATPLKENMTSMLKQMRYNPETGPLLNGLVRKGLVSVLDTSSSRPMK